MANVTQIIEDLQSGDKRAADRLLSAVYDELRRLAARKIARERPGQTLQPTALVHEAYIRLLNDEGANWQNQAHFYGAAAEAMRRILVEAARRKARLKHGGGRRRIGIDEELAADFSLRGHGRLAGAIGEASPIDLIALDDALNQLEAEDAKKAKLVKLRYYAGLTVKEAGEVLGISRATADRYWSYARAWLFDAMGGDQE